MGIGRQGHPGIRDGKMSLEAFMAFSHALTTLRRDTIGKIDKALNKQNLEPCIALTTPYMLVLPFAIASSDLVAALPYRIALRFAMICNLTIFELPIPTKQWVISMLWSALSDQDEANCWLRNSIKQNNFPKDGSKMN
jgi:DNA-binding transcriptional LysR family regulator